MRSSRNLGDEVPLTRLVVTSSAATTRFILCGGGEEPLCVAILLPNSKRGEMVPSRRAIKSRCSEAITIGAIEQ